MRQLVRMPKLYRLQLSEELVNTIASGIKDVGIKLLFERQASGEQLDETWITGVLNRIDLGETISERDRYICNALEMQDVYIFNVVSLHIQSLDTPIPPQLVKTFPGAVVLECLSEIITSCAAQREPSNVFPKNLLTVDEVESTVVGLVDSFLLAHFLDDYTSLSSDLPIDELCRRIERAARAYNLGPVLLSEPWLEFKRSIIAHASDAGDD